MLENSLCLLDGTKEHYLLNCLLPGKDLRGGVEVGQEVTLLGSYLQGLWEHLNCFWDIQSRVTSSSETADPYQNGFKGSEQAESDGHSSPD